MVEINKANQIYPTGQTANTAGGTPVAAQNFQVNIPVGEHKQTNLDIDFIIKKYGVTDETACQILAQCPDFLTKTEEEQAEIMKTVMPAEENNEHKDVIDIDFDSPEWKNKIPEERLQYVLEAGAKAQVGEDKWNSLNDKKRSKAIDKYIKSELSEHIEGWDKMTGDEKLTAISKLVTNYAIAKYNNMDFFELMKLKKNSPEEFDKLEQKYYADGNKEVNLVELRNKNISQFQADSKLHKEAFMEYCGVNNIEDIPSEEYGKKEYEYLKSLNPDELNSHQKIQLKNYEHYVKILGEEKFELMEFGNKGMDSLLTDEELNSLDLVKDKDGNINLYNTENREKIKGIAVKKLISLKSPEEIRDFIKGLNPSGLRDLTAGMNRSEWSPEFKEAFKEVFSHDRTATLAAAVDTADNAGSQSDSAQGFYAANMLNRLDKLSAQSLNKDNELAKIVQKEMTSKYTSVHAAQAQVTAAEIGKEEYVAIGNEGIASRKDAVEVFSLTNKQIAESDKISDEIKEFYAQNSIEVIKSPEARQAQADDLAKYKNEYFDKGVKTGLENAAKFEETTTQQESAKVYGADEQQAPVLYESLSPKAQTVYNTINKTETVSEEKAIKEFIKLSLNEQVDLLRSLSPQQFDKLPVTVCNRFPDLIETFVNIGKGIEIISSCNISTAYKTISIMASGPDNLKKQLAKFASDPQHRTLLSEITYQNLTEQGLISQKATDKPFSMRA